MQLIIVDAELNNFKKLNVPDDSWLTPEWQDADRHTRRPAVDWAPTESQTFSFLVSDIDMIIDESHIEYPAV